MNNLTFASGLSPQNNKDKFVNCTLDISPIVGSGIDVGSKLQSKTEHTSQLKYYWNNTISFFKTDEEISTNTLVGATFAGGTMTTIALMAPATTMPAVVTAITASGAATGGVIGAFMGSSIGWASGGTAIAATVPRAKGGFVLGGSLAANLVSALGLGSTAPAWVLPVTVAGVVIMVTSGSLLAYKYLNNDKNGSGYIQCSSF